MMIKTDFTKVSVVLFFTLIGLSVLPLRAADNIYAVLSAGYNKVEFASAEVSGAGYKLGIGYQFAPQWYLETGYQRLADGNSSDRVPTSTAVLSDFKPEFEGDALYIAILGKAAGQIGELFYRVGVLKTDLKGSEIASGNSCQFGRGKAFSLSKQNYQLCQYDEGALAGMLGLGFDFHLGGKHMLRVEAEYIRGQDKLSGSGFHLGYRFNF